MFSDYDCIRHSLKTFDSVLFSGKSKESELIRRITGSPWSHVGIVVKFQQMESVMLLESTTLTNLVDTLTGRPVKGVQLVFLRERIMTYHGDIAIRRLLAPRTPEKLDALAKFIREVKGRQYEQSKVELINSAVDLPFVPEGEDLSSLFCSELAAEAYQRAGFLKEPPKGKPSNKYVPGEFDGVLTLTDAMQDDLHFIKRVS